MRSRGPWTIPLERLRPRHLALAGSKAVTLGRLRQAGMPVPLGFVLSTRAFEEFAGGGGAWHESQISVGFSGEQDALEAKAISEEICGALAEHKMPAEVEGAINSELQKFPEVRLWAVRSSATTEDLPEASFAGQHDSFLNVPADEVHCRVRQCWLSLFSPRAIAYRHRNRISHERVSMAVIVQQMVPAETAGVLFTADPLTHEHSRIVIEAATGLGEKVVGGHVTPEQITLAKSSLEVLKRSQEAPDHHQTGGAATPPSVDDRKARRLAELSQRVERILPGPLDLEWAICGGDLFLLQARPITGKTQEKSWEDRQVWTNLNTGEVFPDVTTPLTWSLIQSLLDPLFRSVFQLHGVDMSKSPLAGLVAGRIYFNVNTGVAGLKPFSFVAKRIPNLAQALGGGHVELYRDELLAIPDEALPDLKFRWSKYICSWPGILWTIARHSPRRGDAWCASLKARNEDLTKVDLKTMPTPDLARLFGRLVREGFEGWDLLYLVVQAVALPIFQKACQAWLDDKDLNQGYRLFRGLGGVPEAEAGLALWRLTALAHANRETETVLLDAPGWADAAAKLRTTEPGRRFLREWDAFMAQHGHHCRGELELFNARWSETPDYILGVLRGYLAGVDQINPLEHHRQLAQERERLTEQCRARLRNPLKRWIFSRSLRRAQKLAVNREEWKNQAVRQIAFLRRIVLTLGSRLHQAGVLAECDDVFFLEISEVEPLATGGAPARLAERIRRRRNEHERNLDLTPPPVVVGKFRPQATLSPLLRSNGEVLHGIPVSSGVAVGRAKVVLRSDDHQQVRPGEILIAPFTDPAWTPYFVPAAGVVVDQGGILSHGSIVAREYGLPAVTNVALATQAIRTGDLVEVDGNRGRVTVLERAVEREG